MALNIQVHSHFCISTYLKNDIIFINELWSWDMYWQLQAELISSKETLANLFFCPEYLM